MNRRRLGRTGLEVSEISFGAVEIGLDYGLPGATDNHRPTEQQAIRLLERVLELGINFIDTARAYGASEEIIGRALRHRPHQFILCTKVIPDDDAARLEASVADSLRLLAHPVDILMLHSAPLAVIQAPRPVEHLLQLQRRGWFRFLGASVYGVDAALAAIHSGLFDVLQIAFSPLDRRPASSVLPAAHHAGVALVARSVLLKGALTHRFPQLPPALNPLKHAVARLHQLALSAAMDLPELAYRYVLSHDIPQTALVGTARIPELEAAVQYAARGPLPPHLIDAIHREPLLSDKELNPSQWPSD
jgi:aryl-alcohol dehydrogenase-like predicted oxidoreductase